MVCGFDGQLIVYSYFQGLGAGAVIPIATTIVGDIYDGERAKVGIYQCMGISTVSGQLVG